MGYSIFSDIIVYPGKFLAIIDFKWIFLYVFSILLCLSISVFIIYRWGKQTRINKEKIYSKFILALLIFTYFVIIIKLPNNIF